MTMNGSWGYAKNDHNWKSTSTLIRNLCDIASKGGNYLLNVGPSERGEIPPPSLERLREIGAWLKTNGSAIYGTRAAIFPQAPSWGRFTTKPLPDGNTLIHAIVFDPPADGMLRLPGLANPVIAAKVLGSDARVAAENLPDGVRLALPAPQRSQKEFVVAVKVKGKAVLDTATHADEHGVFALSPRQATPTGSIRLQIPASAGLHTAGRENLGCWTNPESTASWTIKSPAPVELKLSATVSAEAPGGSVIEFVCGDQVLPLTIPATGSWDQYQDLEGGTLKLPAGTSTLSVRVKSLQGVAPCNLAGIRLQPVAP
jgi:alpha-L-fucosidase